MITHLKTIAILGILGALLCLMFMFPIVSLTILLIAAAVVVYVIVYRFVSGNQEEKEHIGYDNSGGRD